jgi:stringent starvation protein B
MNNEPPTLEMIEYSKMLKRSILDTLFTKTTSFFIHCSPHSDLLLGQRGLINNEKTDGIVLIFGPYSTRNLQWDENAVFCEMQFGSQWQHVYIPYHCISRMYDKDGQFLMHWTAYNISERKEAEAPVKSEKIHKVSESNVITVDFASRKRPQAD